MEPVSHEQADLDLTSLQNELAVAEDAAALRPLGLRRVVVGDDAIAELPEAIYRLAPAAGAPIAVVADGTPIRRRGRDVKDVIAALLSDFAVLRATVPESNGVVYADAATLDAVCAEVSGSTCIVSVGSGTVTDIAKCAASRLDIPLVAVQTAASVNGFADDQSVLLRGGVKRTVPSQWPDSLFIDLATLAEAPRAMNAAGFGDLLAMFTAPADWYLAAAVGADSRYSPTVVGLSHRNSGVLLELAPMIATGERDALRILAVLLTLTGISIGVAGGTACSSGMEHIVSHLIEMRAHAVGEPTPLHGAAVGVATIVASVLWHRLRQRVGQRGFQGITIAEPEVMRARVSKAFESLDPGGRMGRECWTELEQKLCVLESLPNHREELEHGWYEHERVLDSLLRDPRELAMALRTAGAPTRFSELCPPVAPDVVRWVLETCHLVRNRFTIVDLAFGFGEWEPEDIEAVLDETAAVGGGL